MVDNYLSIKTDAESDYRIKGSKFLCYLRPVSNERDFKTFLKEIREQHKKASHHCSAYRLFNPITEKSSDDGEPSGSAGKPILGQLIKHELQDVAAIVVRYFGGTKLGVRGLIDAYQESTVQAIQNSTVQQLHNLYEFEICHDYNASGFVDKLIVKNNIKIVNQEFSNKVTRLVAVPYTKSIDIFDRLNQLKKEEFGFDKEEYPVEFKEIIEKSES